MRISQNIIKLENLQVKSLFAARQLARGLSLIEESCGIHCVRITVGNVWVCSWIDLDKLNHTPMELLVGKLLKTQQGD